MRGLSLVAASGGHSSSLCAGLSISRPLLLRSTGSRRAGSVIVAHGPSCSVACGIFPDQGSNLCPLHWQADSHPLRHQGSPIYLTFKEKLFSKVVVPRCPTTITINKPVENLVFILIHLFLHLTNIYWVVLCAGPCSRHWGFSNEQGTQNSHPRGADA